MTRQTPHFDIKKMTLEEKASLLCGGSFFGLNSIEAHGIPKLQMLDGGTGMNFEQLLGDIAASYREDYSGIEFDNAIRGLFAPGGLTEREAELRDKFLDILRERIGCEPSPGCYPPGILLGSTWDAETVCQTGDALGLEAALYGISVLLGTPNVNILREPRNGRFFEGYSEDPYLTAELGSQLVIGVEGRGVAANAKHYAANNLEINRVGINEIISERALREIYFPGFKACVDAGCATVMAAYPAINGKNCTENPWLLRDVLRSEWGFNGPVMTDWGACTGLKSDSVRAGIDMIMPGPCDCEEIVNAVKEGRLDEAVVDEGCSRVLSLISRYSRDGGLPDGITRDEYIRIGDTAAYKAAAEGIIMLRNRDGAMPVADGETFILFGNDSGNLLDYGSGSAQVFTDRHKSIGDAIREAAPSSRVLICDIGEFASNPDSTALVICSVFSAEGTDRHDIRLPKDIADTIKGLAALKSRANGRAGKIVLVLNVPGPLELGEIIDDTDAVFCVYYPGMMGSRALTDILLGRINPSGHLTCTFPFRYEDTPAYLNYPDSFTCIYGEDIYVGYRSYDKRGIKPLFPFGFGLSYTDFAVTGGMIGRDEYSLGDEVSVSFTVRNTGKVPGKAVIQLYVGDPVSKLNKPVKELVAFGKYSIGAGESMMGILDFNISRLASFDPDYGRFLVEDGVYNVYLGQSCEDAELIGSFRVTDGDPEYRLGINSTVLTVWETPELQEAIKADIARTGSELQVLVDNYRYTPFRRINEIYGNAAEFTEFIRAAGEFVKD